MQLVVGGYRDQATMFPIDYILDMFKQTNANLHIVTGDCRGVDTLVAQWAHENAVPCQRFVADWNKYGRAAGPIRNQAMLDTKPHLVLAFHPNLAESKGTLSLITLAKKAGLPVIHIDGRGSCRSM